jgi:Reverse transcriptase (RNA-dependent DNA polymerase)
VFVNGWLIVFFFVDDIVTAYDRRFENQFEELAEKLMQEFELRDLGKISWFLGIRVIRDRKKKLWLCQDSYIEKIAKRYHLDGETVYYGTPAEIYDLHQYTANEPTRQPIYAFQSRVGSIQYPASDTKTSNGRIQLS